MDRLRRACATLLLPGLALAADDAEVRAATERLSVRHDPPACATLIAGLRDPAGTLVAIVDRVTMPPWAATRAARCAAALPAAEPSVRRWIVDPAQPGLTEVVIDALDDVPAARADALARVALAGPHAARVRDRLRASDVASLRALGSVP